MDKDFYEYLYNLRSSGFSYTLEEDVRKLAFYASRTDQQPLHLVAQGSDIKTTNVGGDIGTLSTQAINNSRYMLVALAVSMKQLADDYYIDRQVSFSLCDYYIQKVESIHHLEDFERLSGKLMADFHALYTQNPWRRYSAFLNRCIDYIHQRLYSPLTVREVAEYAGYSPEYLTTRFKKETGMTLYTFIQRNKINEAQRALLCTAQPISSIASALGYHSLSHFSKAFKAAVGVTPLQYRNTDPIRREKHVDLRVPRSR